MQNAAVQVAPGDIRGFIEEYFDAWKGTDEDKILAYYSDDIVIHLPTGTLEGKLAVRTTSCDRSSPRFRAIYIRSELGSHCKSGSGGMEFRRRT